MWGRCQRAGMGECEQQSTGGSPSDPFNACSHGVAADPSGTGVVRHRDLVASGAPSLMGPPSTSGQPPKRLKTDKAAKQQQQQQQQAEFDPSVVSEGRPLHRLSCPARACSARLLRRFSPAYLHPIVPDLPWPSAALHAALPAALGRQGGVGV